MKKIDFLIVGQGLAGSALAYTLHKRGQKIGIVADNRPTSTAVAAGIYNPITGRKLVKTWHAEKLFPFLEHFYQSLERELDTNFLHPCAIYRPYRNIEEQKAYLNQSAHPEIAPFLNTKPDNEPFRSWIHNDFGGLETTVSGWLDTQLFCQSLRTYFEEQNLFYTETFDSQELDAAHRTWRAIEFDRLIFCEGVSGRGNEWFSWLPFSPVKGELLNLKMEDINTQIIVNQGVWLLPVGEGQFKLGATYDWKDLTWQPTEKATKYLTEKLENWLKVGYQVQSQQAGIRPATADRRPFVGLHPEQQMLGIFNGLGSKGVSLAPFLASQFADFLLDGKELDPEVNIERYFSLYFSAKQANL